MAEADKFCFEFSAVAQMLGMDPPSTPRLVSKMKLAFSEARNRTAAGLVRLPGPFNSRWRLLIRPTKGGIESHSSVDEQSGPVM